MSDESCDPFEWGSAAKAFWQGEFERTNFYIFLVFLAILKRAVFYAFLRVGEFDKSCVEANAEDDAMCNVFSTYYLDVETPWMIVAPLEEIEPTVNC